MEPTHRGENMSTFRGVVQKRVNQAQKRDNSNTRGQFMRILFFLVVFIVFTVIIYQKTMTGSLQNIHLNEFPLLQRLADNNTLAEVRENVRNKIEEFTQLVTETIENVPSLSQETEPATISGSESGMTRERSDELMKQVRSMQSRIQSSIDWIAKLEPTATQLRWDLTASADVHILHKLGSYLKRVLASDNAEAILTQLIDKGHQCSEWENNLQEIISKKISMDICSEVEWYKVVHLAWPEAKDFMDIGANKGYLGSLFVSLWGGGGLGMAPITVFELSNKLGTWKASRNPAGYCKDGYNYGIPLYCPIPRAAPLGQCMTENPDVHVTSIDGSAYLRETLTNIITKEMPNQKVAKVWEYLNFAMSNEKGIARFTMQNKDTNAGFEGGQIKKADAKNTVEVNMTSVDLFMSEHNMHRLDLLKIDTEGNDNKVIMGAGNVVTNYLGMITFEGGKGVTLSKEMIADFDSLGFSCYSTSRAGLFKWNGGCMKDKYMGGFAAKDKGNIFCVNRQRAPMVSLAYDILSFPMMIDELLETGKVDAATRSKWTSPETSATVDISELFPAYINIKPFCKPWPSCAQLN